MIYDEVAAQIMLQDLLEREVGLTRQLPPLPIVNVRNATAVNMTAGDLSGVKLRGNTGLATINMGEWNKVKGMCKDDYTLWRDAQAMTYGLKRRLAQRKAGGGLVALRREEI